MPAGTDCAINRAHLGTWCAHHMLARDIDDPERSWYVVLVSHSSGAQYVLQSPDQWPATRAYYP